FALLYYACAWHERGRVSDDPTIGACWDADRLDLPRVGTQPMPELMSTEEGKARARAVHTSRRGCRRMDPQSAKRTAQLDDVRAVQLEPFHRRTARWRDADDFREISSPVEVLIPAIAARAEQWYELTSGRIGGRSSRELRVVTPLA